MSTQLSKMIREAKAGGADYVQTPEMTNILVRKRDELMEKIVAEDDDASLGATFASWRAKLSIWLHIGSLAIKVSPEHAANRSFLISPQGDIAARYDKIHMFDVDLAGGESYREIEQLQGRAISRWSLTCRGADSASPFATTCVFLALSRARRSQRARSSRSRRRSRARPAKHTGTC